MLERAADNARALNQQFGLPLTKRPASGVYTPNAMSITWFQGFIADGNPRDGRRYAEDGPIVSTEVTDGPNGPQLRLMANAQPSGDRGLRPAPSASGLAMGRSPPPPA